MCIRLQGLANPKKKKDTEKKFSLVGEPFLGATLKGMQYTPPFSYFEAARTKDGSSGAFRIICGDFVTEENGTGVVHCAPAFGEEDYKICIAEKVVAKDNVDTFCPLDANGRFTSVVSEWEGLFVKDADRGIIKHLKERGKMVDVGVINHSYPFCYRSDTPLIYRAVPSTFVNVRSHSHFLSPSPHHPSFSPLELPSLRPPCLPYFVPPLISYPPILLLLPSCDASSSVLKTCYVSHSNEKCTFIDVC